ncbi:unnamed protein product [Didymodactylos carnosus]|uniref:MULE transposase domain-containing protein n=1 Tax=Didymodactylos carnosus TaxID=1234261 RepID=A0A8S2PKY7_9BILA|nr:unnamed protein product [Didymodactylos carnosus]CAF4054047.1 unnamed protein product [Didymodactylos carnosus]
MYSFNIDTSLFDRTDNDRPIDFLLDRISADTSDRDRPRDVFCCRLFEGVQLSKTSHSVSPHDVFVPRFAIDSCDRVFIFFTTRQLVSIGSLLSLLQVDATFKVNWNEIPLLVLGSSDSNRHFHLYGVALISTDEAADSYMHVFQTFKQVVQSVTGIVFNVAYLLGDGATGITASQQREFPTAKRLMCWAHTLRKCRERRKMVPSDKWPDIENDICTLQLAFGDGVFDVDIKLLLKK